MVDEEVENTLREIRERVRKTAEFEADSPVALASSPPNGSHTPPRESSTNTDETLARIDADLTTTARAWDRLPPLVSRRSGGLARLELWVKQRLKLATRWYSWEQINFNAAAHHALRHTLEALRDLDQQLRQLRAEMSAKLDGRAQQNQTEMMAQRAEIQSQRGKIESQRAEMEAYRAQLEAEQRARSVEVNARLTDLAQELRERDGQRLEEQRVCFKQLSLEMSEAEVLLDRARRDLESRLDKLESSQRES